MPGKADPAPEGHERSQEHAQAQARPGSSGVPGVPGVPGENRPGSSLRFQHQIENTDQSPPTTGLRKPGATSSIDNSVSQEEISALQSSLGAARLQGLRVANFAFEPVSLPASRTASHDDDSRHASGQQTPASSGSPMLGARTHGINSPPLTPSGNSYLEADKRVSPKVSTEHNTASPGQRPGVITPQESSSRDAARPASRSQLATGRPSSSEDVGRRPVSSSSGQDNAALGNHRKGMFTLGPTGSGSSGGGGKSLPVSREVSPSRNNSASQYYTRPFTPAGEPHDPYAANKRPPQSKVVEPRFVFPRVYRRKDRSPSSSTISPPKAKEEKRHSGLFGNHRKEELAASDSSTHSRQGSMSDLKRFFRKGGPSHHHKIKRAVSPAMSIRSAKNKSSTHIPFSDEHSLTSKYGKLGKVLGSGAGGSVRLMKRSEDNTVFAVKEFRPRHTYESEKDYVKKLTAEYCIGSSLHHGNIIETLDIIREKSKWYEVMEYAPYDLFAIVMTGKMTRAEVACCFLQILSGVTYLHSMGLAHRDLKLDNVVVSEYGIMKIIDFGSAHVFKYPFESGMVKATGIVGSDPYLAPEVYDERQYDPTAVDIWSLAIIFCCMTLRRFPWKVPRMSDNSFKLFASDPTPGHDPKKLALAGSKAGSASKSDHDHADDTAEKTSEPDKTDKSDPSGTTITEPAAKEAVKEEPMAKADGEDMASVPADKPDEIEQDPDRPAGEKPIEKSENPEKSGKSDEKPAEKREIIKGPWRILRLLPRESRHVIGEMLAINPKERIQMADILKDQWIANTVICRQTEPGRVLRASSHTHILEQPAPAVPKQ